MMPVIIRAGWLGGGFLAALGFGFLGFVNALGDEQATPETHADAIVALTGGSERILDAVELLEDGRARRLLITGVNRSTSPERLASTLPQHRHLFECCIDMDYEARNTVGNAVETRRWIDGRNVRSLIVVTSSYHMPRAMLELQRALPDVTLLPHPVSPDRPPEFSAWRSLSSTRVLATEYGKFLAAYVRASLFPQIATDRTATGSLHRGDRRASILPNDRSGHRAREHFGRERVGHEHTDRYHVGQDHARPELVGEKLVNEKDVGRHPVHLAPPGLDG